MKNRVVRGSLYLLGVVAVIALVGGYALGAFTFGTFTSVPRQTSASGLAPGAPAGVSFPLAEAEMVSPSTIPATGQCTASNLGTSLSPTPLTDGASTGICLSTSVSGFASGDVMFLVEVAWDSTAIVLQEFKVDIFFGVTPAANNLLATSYVMTSGTITVSETAVFALDLAQSGDTSVSQFSVLVTQ